MYGYIYLITDTKNGKLYVGQHRYDKFELDPTYHGSGRIIRQIYNKRPETLEYKLLISADCQEVLDFYERFFIKHLNTLVPNGYNLTKGGDDNPMNNRVVVAKHKKSMSSEEVRRKIAENTPRHYGEKNGMYGRGYLIEGEKNGMYGKHHTEETKEHLREVFSGEGNPQYGKRGELSTCYGRTGEKHPMYGKHQTEEAKQKIAESSQLTGMIRMFLNPERLIKTIIKKAKFKKCQK